MGERQKNHFRPQGASASPSTTTWTVWLLCGPGVSEIWYDFVKHWMTPPDWPHVMKQYDWGWKVQFRSVLQSCYLIRCAPYWQIMIGNFSIRKTRMIYGELYRTCTNNFKTFICNYYECYTGLHSSHRQPYTTTKGRFFRNWLWMSSTYRYVREMLRDDRKWHTVEE